MASLRDVRRKLETRNCHGSGKRRHVENRESGLMKGVGNG